MKAKKCAKLVGGPINTFGSRFMLDASFYGRAIAAGYAGYDFYFTGRAGVLGEVDSDVVAASFGFLSPALVREQWSAGRAVGPVADAAVMWMDSIGDWAAAHMPEDFPYDELNQLAAAAVDAAPAAGLPLFAGWRAHPRPEDPRHLAAHLLNVLREHRGGSHIVAVVAHGLTPLEAILASPAGPGTARFFGYEEPFPEIDDSVRTARKKAEATTNELAAWAYRPLTADQRARFATLAVALHDSLG